MRTVIAVAVLASACTPAERPPVTGDAAPGTPDAVHEPLPVGYLRRPTAVVVNATHVAWSMSEPMCALEAGYPCGPAEPTVLHADLATGTVTTLPTSCSTSTPSPTIPSSGTWCAVGRGPPRWR